MNALFRSIGQVSLTAVLAAVVVGLLAATAQAFPPNVPSITEPSFDGEVVSPADVHMEANGYSDPDGDAFQCSDWSIWTVDTNEQVWESPPCVTFPLSVHIHLGDGFFVGPLTGNDALDYDTNYQVRVDFCDVNNDCSDQAVRNFRTEPAGPAGVPGDNPWVVKQPNYQVTKFASGLQLPTDIAFVPNPGPNPNDPFMYVTELYGTIAMITRDGTVHDYADNVLNYDPMGNFPGSGEQGLTGIVVDPASGDVFASDVYSGAPLHDGDPFYDQVIRFHSTDGGRTADGPPTQVANLDSDPSAPSHQVSNLTIGPDGKLYVHVGDGFNPALATDVNSYLGKILRMNLDGTPATGNPFYSGHGPPYGPSDYIVSRGYRNPFGGAWRASNGAHYTVENGPDVNDRLSRIDLPIPAGGYNFGWDDTGASMLTGALYTWSPTHAPVNVAIVQPQTYGGSGFPADQQDHAFVSESGPTYASGPQPRGKRIVEFDPEPSTGEYGSNAARPLVEYGGVGKATVVGLAAGPNGLYFTDLYKDDGTAGSDPGANIWRVSYDPAQPGQPPGGSEARQRTFDLRAAKRRCKKKFRGKRRAKCIKRAQEKARRL